MTICLVEENYTHLSSLPIYKATVFFLSGWIVVINLFIFNVYLFIYLFGHAVQTVDPSSLTRDQTHAPCTGSMAS